MTLVILAAGLGSRYGGLKQLDPVGPGGEFIIDYSIFDAVRSGFDEVCFIIKKEHEEDFKATIVNRIEKKVKVSYAYQDISDVPQWFTVPAERKKPWGTAHALLCTKDVVKGDFIVLNADDFYGREAFAAIAKFMQESKKDEKLHYCVAGYKIKNTITDNGHVSRGVCEVDDSDMLTGIVERVKIEKRSDGIAYEDGDKWVPLSEDTPVSMNIWGFSDDIFPLLEREFELFLKKPGQNLEKAEFFLPLAIEAMIDKNLGDVKVLDCNSKWYGVTYKEDRPSIVAFLKSAADTGVYPSPLWD